MAMPKGDLIAFLAVASLALFLAEMEVRREASLTWMLVALLWIILVGMLIWLAYG